mmetsp:Transcript_16849/g.29181  ORF Transcript_16849/g.29181 Transcript_16849/m.29181 type:complete len:87 (+) Transcript_16849:2433-2693(+)
MTGRFSMTGRAALAKLAAASTLTQLSPAPSFIYCSNPPPPGQPHLLPFVLPQLCCEKLPMQPPILTSNVSIMSHFFPREARSHRSP